MWAFYFEIWFKTWKLYVITLIRHSGLARYRADACQHWPDIEPTLNVWWTSCFKNKKVALRPSCPDREQFVLGWVSTLSVSYQQYMVYVYGILPNKCAFLNKRAPDFWLWLDISQKLLNRSQSNFEYSLLRYPRVHIVNFIEIRQD